ncbi:DUF4936 family protein [Sphaerotilus sp.]|uniref:DUF4936 family protein n=1 Tax=Sphaerotilus sp. TaxID=2093942 RepID=UPI00286DA254|nr:DUF4936 family protein [Sphaerotilus sp.]
MDDDTRDAELYVYYRVPATASAQAQAQAEIQAAHAALRKSWPALASRCLQRPEIRDGMRTWMEIHHQPGGLDAATIANICAMLSPWPSARVGPRHTEIFATLPTSGAL